MLYILSWILFLKNLIMYSYIWITTQDATKMYKDISNFYETEIIFMLVMQSIVFAIDRNQNNEHDKYDQWK